MPQRLLAFIAALRESKAIRNSLSPARIYVTSLVLGIPGSSSEATAAVPLPCALPFVAPLLHVVGILHRRMALPFVSARAFCHRHLEEHPDVEDGLRRSGWVHADGSWYGWAGAVCRRQCCSGGQR